MKSIKSLFNGLAGQTMIYGLGTIVPRLLNYLLLTPFFTRVFNTEAYGTFSVFYAFSSFTLVMLLHGMETTYFRFSVQNDEQKTYNHALFSTTLFASAFLIFILLFRNQVAGWIEYPNNVNYIVCFGFIIFFDVITAIPFARLRNQNKALKFSIIKLINVSISILLNIFFYVVCRNSDNSFLASLYDPEVNVGYAFFSNLVASVFSFLLLLPEFKTFRPEISFDFYKSMLKYTWPFILIGASGMINEVFDKIFLKFIHCEGMNPLEQVGIYSANYKIAVL